MDEATMRNRVLNAAKEIINGDRAEAYGDAHTNFTAIAHLWTTYISRRGMVGEFRAEDVALMMTLVKIARLAGQPTHWDSWLDIAGYAALGAEVTDMGYAGGIK